MIDIPEFFGWGKNTLRFSFYILNVKKMTLSFQRAVGKKYPKCQNIILWWREET